MLYKEKAIYAAKNATVTVEVQNNGEFRIYNSKRTFQSGNLKDYYVTNNGHGPGVGATIWKKYGNVNVKDELLFYDKLIMSPGDSEISEHNRRKKEFLKITKRFGSRSILKVPNLLYVLFIILFLGLLSYLTFIKQGII